MIEDTALKVNSLLPNAEQSSSHVHPVYYGFV